MKRFLNTWVAALLLCTLILLGTLTLTATARSAPPYPPPADPHDQMVHHLTGSLAQPLSPIIEIEWTRIHSGTLDGVFYDDLYWGGIHSSSPTLVDIDDDGDLDLFVYGGNRLSGDNGEVHFFRNDGSTAAPSWTHVTANYFGQYRYPVRFVDLDGDGDFDAVLQGVIWEPEGFIYYENTGSASTPQWVLRTTDMLGDGRSGEGENFALADLDGDGDPDLFFLTSWEEDGDWHTSIVFYENTGSPTVPAWTFVTSTYGDIIGQGGKHQSFMSLAFADIDADGDLDLFLGESTRIRHYRNDGNASASIWTFVTDTYGGIGLPYQWAVMQYVLTFGDLNGNGTLDLVFGHTLGWLSSYKNTGTPANASWTLWVDGMLPMDFGLWANPALADIDDDGDLDLFLGSASGLNDAHFVFLRNDGTPATPLWTYVTGGYGGTDPYMSLKHPTFVDIDGDGDLDLFIGDGPFFDFDDGTLHYYENTGTPGVAVFTLITDTYLGIVGPSAHVAPAFADIDGDGDYDLFVAVSGRIRYYRNDGDATLPVWTYVTDNYMGIDASALAFADVDGDDDLDMFTDRAYYRNDGNATAPRWVQRGTPLGLAWSGGPPALGDLLGGDGRPDLLLGGSGGVHLYHNLRGSEIEPPVDFGKSAPTDGAINQPLSLTLSWEASEGAAVYEYCYDTTEDDACDGAWVSTGTELSAELSGLSTHTTYFWQVHATNIAGTTDADAGAWWSFTTTLNPAAEFSGDPTAGPAPLQVQFTDESMGNPTGWAWYFGDEDFSESWAQQTASAGWSARRNHASVALPDGSIVLMGGYDSSRRNDVWRSIDKGVTWTQMTASAAWSARNSHAAVVLPDGSIVLMGGYDGSGRRNDVWRSIDKGITWAQVTASADWSARYGMLGVVLQDESILLIGGNDGISKNDIWRSADQGATWNQVNANAEWPGRDYFAVVMLADNCIVLMGGESTVKHNDVWRSTDQGATWTPSTAAAEWPGRYGLATIVLPDGSIVLMGGAGYDNFRWNDVWRSTDQGTTWTLLTDSAGWAIRNVHTSVALPDGSIVLMGGYNTSAGNLRDVWRWDTAGSYEQHPSHTYTEPEIYTVALQAYNSAGYGSTLKAAYITVNSACPMDMDGDGQVTVLDIQDVASRWLAEAASGPPYDIRYDVAPPGAPDGVINIADIQMIAAAFMSCPILP